MSETKKSGRICEGCHMIEPTFCPRDEANPHPDCLLRPLDGTEAGKRRESRPDGTTWIDAAIERSERRLLGYYEAMQKYSNTNGFQKIKARYQERLDAHVDLLQIRKQANQSNQTPVTDGR